MTAAPQPEFDFAQAFAQLSDRLEEKVARAASTAASTAIRRQTPARLDDPNKLLTVQQAADLLQCSEHHIADLIDEGRLAAIDLASPNATRHAWRIKTESINQLLTAN